MNDSTPGTSNLIRLHALQHTFQQAQRQLEQNPIRNDIFAQQVNINARNHVVAAFECLEQSLKALIQEHDTTYNENQMKADGHNLNAIFGRLESLPSAADDIQRISLGFEAYQSLHEEEPRSTISNLLKNIGGDYNLWRYYPLTGWGDKSPANANPYLMFELVTHIHGVIAKHVATDHGLATVCHRLNWCISQRFVDHLTKFCIRLPAEHGLIDQANAWAKVNRGLLNGISVRLHRRARNNEEHTEAIDPVIVSTIESTMLDLERPESEFFQYAGMHNVQSFYRRAQEDSRPLIWDGRLFKRGLLT